MFFETFTFEVAINVSLSSFSSKGLTVFAGYATDPRYPQKLISIIERYKLYEYDQKVLGSDYQFVANKTEEVVATNYGAQAQTYTVQAGDTLYGICQKFNSSVDYIKQLNQLNTNTLSVGQIIKIQ